ncbi:MAG: AMP-binding protein, partial [Streptosporangiales bacterium]|nr:AMP-binding protein [Streptosporangiales bacterium]
MSQPAADIPVVADIPRRRRALEERHGPWRPRRLSEMLDAVADEYAHRPYVIAESRTYTYGELRDWSRRVARGLVAAGIGPGDHVALVAPNWPETVAVRFGIARAGAVAVPVNFQLRAEELAYILQQSRAVTVVTMEEFRGIDALD